MKTYDVTLPISGYAIVQVEAENKEAAIDAAMDAVEMDDIEEWETHRHIVQGNVFYGKCNDVEVELAIGEEDEEDGDS